MIYVWTILMKNLWYGKIRVTTHELRVTSYKLRVESLKARVKIQKCEFKSTSYEFKSTSYEFKPTSYEFESTSYEFKSTSYKFKPTSYEFQSMIYELKSTSSRIIKWMKTQVNSLNSPSFPKIISPKLFGNPMILDKFAFSFAFNIRKQNVTDFSSISLTQNFVLCL